MTEQDPKTRGYEAYYEGLPPDANPHRYKQNRAMMSWFNGWNRAKREHEQQTNEREED